MENEKTAFLMYSDYEQHFSLLSLEDRGRLITAILSYANTRELPSLSGEVRMAFSFIKLMLDRDFAKWKETVSKRSQAGKQGGESSGKSRSGGKSKPASQNQEAAAQPISKTEPAAQTLAEAAAPISKTKPAAQTLAEAAAPISKTKPTVPVFISDNTHGGLRTAERGENLKNKNFTTENKNTVNKNEIEANVNLLQKNESNEANVGFASKNEANEAVNVNENVNVNVNVNEYENVSENENEVEKISAYGSKEIKASQVSLSRTFSVSESNSGLKARNTESNTILNAQGFNTGNAQSGNDKAGKTALASLARLFEQKGINIICDCEIDGITALLLADRINESKFLSQTVVALSWFTANDNKNLTKALKGGYKDFNFQQTNGRNAPQTAHGCDTLHSTRTHSANQQSREQNSYTRTENERKYTDDELSRLLANLS